MIFNYLILIAFNSVHALIFVASLVDYNAVLFEDSNINSMYESLNVFEKCVNMKYFDKSALILILNKDDLFREKLKNNIPLSVCFSEEAGWPYQDEYWIDNENETTKTNTDTNLTDNNNNNTTAMNEDFEIYHRKCTDFIFGLFSKRIHTNRKQIWRHVTNATQNTIVEKVFVHVQTILIHNNMASSGLAMGSFDDPTQWNLSNDRGNNNNDSGNDRGSDNSNNNRNGSGISYAMTNDTSINPYDYTIRDHNETKDANSNNGNDDNSNNNDNNDNNDNNGKKRNSLMNKLNNIHRNYKNQVDLTPRMRIDSATASIDIENDDRK